MGFSFKDVELVAQAQNFAAVLSADASVYGQTPETAALVSAAVATYVESFNTLIEARANGVRSEPMTATRNAHRAEMLNLMRPIYSGVQASKSISDEAKIALGVHLVPTRRRRSPAPDFAPLLSVVKVDGHLVTLHIGNPNDPSSKSRPKRTAGISIFSYVGEEPSRDAGNFKFEFVTGHVQTNVPFPESVPIGATVYFTASFFNNRKQSGPLSTPIRATLGAGSMMPASMKIAA
jgi:hypothetical protein